jgi:DNA-binding MarR family transcriptional regulator
MRPTRDLDDALELLHFAFRQVVLEPDRILAERGLGRVHHRVLFMCRRCEGLSIGELQAILGVSKQALNRPLRDLFERDLLAATPDEADRRVSRLALTAKGKKFEEKVSGAQRAAFQRAFDAIGPRARTHWEQVMAELGAHRTASSILKTVRTP